MPETRRVNARIEGARGVSRIALIGFACLAVVCAGCQTAPPGPRTFVGVHGRLSVKGNQIVDKNGIPTTLHGMSLYCWAQQGWQFFNPSAINHFAQDWKCTVIRIAIRPGDYKQNPTKEINKVKTVMDACISNGIYGIIDWHSMQGAQNDVASSQAFFSTLAAAYGKTPNIMYEPWNEPEQEPWTVIKAYHEAIIKTIRAIDPESIIICGSRHWDQECAEASQNPITISKNIAYSIHFYAASHRQSLRNNGAQALKNGVALFSTEYGASTSSGGGTFDPAETKLWWTWLDANNVGCANWSAAALGETSAAFQPGPGTSATGPWTDAMLKPSGLLVRDYIISKYIPPQP
ncbi:MAG: glycoside hydrolase family 5 protein [Verrucomicrobiota bacterium]